VAVKSFEVVSKSGNTDGIKSVNSAKKDIVTRMRDTDVVLFNLGSWVNYDSCYSRGKTCAPFLYVNYDLIARFKQWVPVCFQLDNDHERYSL
jgi:hypothetical protein